MEVGTAGLASDPPYCTLDLSVWMSLPLRSPESVFIVVMDMEVARPEVLTRVIGSCTRSW